MRLVNKITHGYVVQQFDIDNGKLICQYFVAGDDVSYEGEDDHSLDGTETPYEQFDMVQPLEY